MLTGILKLTPILFYLSVIGTWGLVIWSMIRLIKDSYRNERIQPKKGE